MITIKNIDHIVLTSTNPNAMVDFYCNMLGCKIENEQPNIGLTQLRAGSNIIDIVQLKDHITETKTKNLEHFCLRVEPYDFEKLNHYFQQHGITVARPGIRYGAEGYGHSFYIQDPEGNEIEIRGPVEKN